MHPGSILGGVWCRKAGVAKAGAAVFSNSPGSTGRGTLCAQAGQQGSREYRSRTIGSEKTALGRASWVKLFCKRGVLIAQARLGCRRGTWPVANVVRNTLHVIPQATVYHGGAESGQSTGSLLLASVYIRRLPSYTRNKLSQSCT